MKRLRRWVRVGVWVLGAAGVCCFCGASVLLVQNHSRKVPLDPHRAHQTSQGFRNNFPHEEHGFRQLLRWSRERRHVEVERREFPLTAVAPELLAGRQAVDQPGTVTWIGHSTFLVQLDGVNLLTDPHLTERASPVSWAGPKRVTRAAIALDQLPPIDVVVISHSHYDHLDHGTVFGLLERQEDAPPLFLVPLGLERLLRRWGASRVVELDWWESYSGAADDGLAGWTFQATPVQHFSARTPFDANATLWAGWSLDSTSSRLFFAGDTGYSPDFQEIGRRLGPFDLGLIPIGAYEPRWFMRSMHLNPAEAVAVHLDIGARRSIGMHWGTFILTDEPLEEPPQHLRQALAAHHLPLDQFIVLSHGQTVSIKPQAVALPAGVSP